MALGNWIPDISTFSLRLSTAAGRQKAQSIWANRDPAIRVRSHCLEGVSAHRSFWPGTARCNELSLGALAVCERQARVANKGAEAEVDGFRFGDTGTVRVSGTPIIMEGVISSMIGKSQQAHQDVRVDRSYDYAPDLATQFSVGALDLAILRSVETARKETGHSARFLPARMSWPASPNTNGIRLGRSASWSTGCVGLMYCGYLSFLRCWCGHSPGG